MNLYLEKQYFQRIMRANFTAYQVRKQHQCRNGSDFVMVHKNYLLNSLSLFLAASSFFFSLLRFFCASVSFLVCNRSLSRCFFRSSFLFSAFSLCISFSLRSCSLIRFCSSFSFFFISPS